MLRRALERTWFRIHHRSGKELAAEWLNGVSEEMRDKATFCVTRGRQEAGILWTAGRSTTGILYFVNACRSVCRGNWRWSLIFQVSIIAGSCSVPSYKKLLRLIHLPPLRKDSCQHCAGEWGGGVLSCEDRIPDGITITERVFWSK